MESKGTLEPVVRQDVFAGIDGVVQELYCDHGDMVKKDQLLVQLRNTELEVALTDVQGQRLANNERLFAVQRSLVEEKKLSIEERNRLAGEQAELRQKQQIARRPVASCTRPSRWSWTSRAPSPGWWSRGTCGTGCHPSARCSAARCLLRVADPDGPWQLELHMPENRMGHIVKAPDRLPTTGCRCRTSWPPSRARPATARSQEIHRSAEVRGDEGNTVLIKVAIDKSDLPDLRPGATVTAQVDCGRRALGYVLLHDVIAFIQSRILFRYF